MALLPDMDTYDWNEYYLVLAAAIFPALAVEFGDLVPDIIVKLLNIINVGVVATLAFVRRGRNQ